MDGSLWMWVALSTSAKRRERTSKERLVRHLLYCSTELEARAAHVDTSKSIALYTRSSAL